MKLFKMNFLSAACVFVAAFVAVATPAKAQSEFKTPTIGKTVPGVVGMCIDASGNAVPCSNTGALSVGGFDVSVANTPTVQNAAYSSGNAIGGLQTIQFFRTTAQPSGILNNVSVASKGGSTTAITLYIFNANPTATTCTDKSAFSLGAADVAKIISSGPIVMTPAVVGAGSTVTFAAAQSPVSTKNGDGTATLNLYVCAVVGGSVTPASTTDLIFKFAGVQD